MCQHCPAGKQCGLGKVLRPCVQFLFNDGTGKDGDFRACTIGFEGNAKVGATFCRPCPPGTFKRKFGRRCLRCSGGKIVVLGASACVTKVTNTACPTNFFRHAEDFCARCEKRDRLNKTVMKCQECPANHQSDGGLDTVCRPCPPGSTRPLGTEECICSPGWVTVEGPVPSCKKCPPGTFSSKPSSECAPYPAGMFASKGGMSECLMCRFNLVQPVAGKTTCDRCLRGLVPNPVRGCLSPATNCLPGDVRVEDKNKIVVGCNPKTCPPDTFRKTTLTPLDSVAVERCESCNLRSRYDPALNICIQCPRISAPYSDGGISTDCFNTICENGFVREFTGECRCRSSREIVNGKCQSCLSGTFGFFEPIPCEPCPPGTFTDRERSFMCRNCPMETFSDEKGAVSCKPCPDGLITVVAGSANCVIPLARNSSTK